MPRSLDIETLVEEAFLGLLPTYLDADVKAIRWQDIKDSTLTPCVKVAVTTGTEVEGTYNLYCATDLIIDFGIFTSKKKDEDGKTSNDIRGQVRNMLNQDDIKAQLEAISAGLVVYNTSVRPQSSTSAEDGKVWQKQITILLSATTEEVTP